MGQIRGMLKQFFCFAYMTADTRFKTIK